MVLNPVTGYAFPEIGSSVKHGSLEFGNCVACHRIFREGYTIFLGARAPRCCGCDGVGPRQLLEIAGCSPIFEPREAA
jgi:NAD-dependent SIR2 family protein deacetylase